MPKIAVVGGTGIYNPDTFELIEEVYPDTPYGKPSDKILIGKTAGPRLGSFLASMDKKFVINRLIQASV